MVKHPKLSKPERKRRIKDQNKKKKGTRSVSYDAKTPEELKRQMEGFFMIAFGLLKVVGIDALKVAEEIKAKAAEFPSEPHFKSPTLSLAPSLANDQNEARGITPAKSTKGI